MYGCSTLPSGTLNVNGTVFDIAGANGGNNAWFSSAAANNGPGTVNVTIPINLKGATTVYTLMNTFWGQTVGSYDTVTFTGSSGTTYSVDLYGDKDIRDYNAADWTNSVSGNTQQAWTNSTDSQRLDMQTFVLPSDFADQTLVSMTITDNASTVYSRIFLAGLTVDPADPVTVPEPAPLALVGGVLIAAGIFFRRRRAV